MFTVVFAVSTFILTPLQAQHATYCQMAGGYRYEATTDTCYKNMYHTYILPLSGAEIGEHISSTACDGMVPVKECTAEF